MAPVVQGWIVSQLLPVIPVEQLHPQSFAIIVPVAVPPFWQGDPFYPKSQSSIV